MSEKGNTCVYALVHVRFCPYDDQVSAEEWNFLFNDSNDDDDAFHGF